MNRSHWSSRKIWLALGLLLATCLTTIQVQAKTPESERRKEVKAQPETIEKQDQPGARQAFLGVVPRPLDHVMRAALDYEEPGVLLAEVVPDSPAGKAGVRVGEILVKFDQRPVHDVERLFALMKEQVAGEAVELLLYHKGTTRTLRVLLEARPKPELGWMEQVPGLLELNHAGAAGSTEALERELKVLLDDGGATSPSRQLRIYTQESPSSEIN